MNVGAVLGVALLLVVPGVPASLALARPGRLDPATRLALVPVLGAAVVGAIAFVLTVAGVLSPVSFFLALGVVAAGLLAVVVLRDGGPAAHLRAGLATVRADPWPFLLGAGVVAAIVVVRWTFLPEAHFSSTSSWRYWADGVEIADAGGIPAASLQHGGPLVPTVSKVFLNAMHAGVAFTVGRAPLPALGALLFVFSVSLAAVLWALGRELGLRWTAPILVLVVMANRSWLGGELTTDFDVYRAENVGRVLAFGALALFVHALRRRRPGLEVAAAGAVLGASVGVHLVPSLVVAVLAGAYGLAVLLRQPGRRRTAVRGLVAAGAGGVVVAALLVLPSGDLGLTGVGGDEAYAAFDEDFDPTLFINAGLTPEEQASGSPTDWSLTLGRSYRAFVATMLNEPTGEGLRPREPDPLVDRVGPWVLVAGILLAAAGLARFPFPLRPATILPLALGMAIVVLTWWFSQRSEYFIPSNFGLRRLHDFAALPVFLGALLALELGFRLLRRERVRVSALLAVSLTAYAGAALLPEARMIPGLLSKAARQLPMMRWIARNVPCDSLILTNDRTEGIYQALIGRPGVLEGMTPYLRPDVLPSRIELFLESQAFFADPAGAFEPLAERGVTHVVILEGEGERLIVGTAGAGLVGQTEALRLVHATDAFRVYEVRPGHRRGAPPDAAAYPGYHCVTDPEF